MLLSNFHSHTVLCKHASGTVNDYCQSAVNFNFKTLGISDHTPLPDNKWSSVRMSLSQLPGYCAQIDEAKTRYPSMRIFKGMECDYASDYVDFYREHLLKTLSFDYLIGAVHWFPFEGEWVCVYKELNSPQKLKAYTEHYLNAMKSGLFSFMAHPDVFGNAYLEWDEACESAANAICSLAKEMNLPLEINGYGFMKPWIETSQGCRPLYPWKPFWETASRFKLKIIVNSDAHRPEDLTGGILEALEISKTFKLSITDPLF